MNVDPEILQEVQAESTARLMSKLALVLACKQSGHTPLREKNGATK